MTSVLAASTPEDAIMVDQEDTAMEDAPFDDATWDAYMTAMEQMIAKPGVIKKTKPHEIDKCRVFLMSRQSLTPVSIFQQRQQSSS
jgi:hypothetical protein